MHTDQAALGLIGVHGHDAMTPETKRDLVAVLHADYLTAEGVAPVGTQPAHVVSDEECAAFLAADPQAARIRR